MKSGLNLLDDVQMYKTHFRSSKELFFKSNGFKYIYILDFLYIYKKFWKKYLSVLS